VERFTRRWRLILLLFLLGLTASFCRPRSWRHHGPISHGKYLSEWLEEAFYTDERGFVGGAGNEFKAALQEIGTNAIPELMRRVRAHDNLRRPNSLAKIILRVPGKKLEHSLQIHLGIFEGYLDQRRAIYGFRALGVLATNAIPLLVEVSDSTSAAVETLGAIGPVAFPALRHYAREGSKPAKLNAMMALAQPSFDFKRDETVDVWIDCLTDPDPYIRTTAAMLIGSASPIRAQQAIPHLKQAANDSDTNVAAAAKSAIGKIRLVFPNNLF
jgi:hypothetical protein